MSTGSLGDPGTSAQSTGARTSLTRAWLSVIVMLVAIVGLFYVATGVQVEALAGKPLNMTGLTVAIGAGVVSAVCAVLALVFGARAYQRGMKAGLVPFIVGVGGALVVALAVIQVIVGVTTGRWT